MATLIFKRTGTRTAAGGDILWDRGPALAFCLWKASICRATVIHSLLRIRAPTLTRAALQIHASESKPRVTSIIERHWGHMSASLTQFVETRHEPNVLEDTEDCWMGWSGCSFLCLSAHIWRLGYTMTCHCRETQLGPQTDFMSWIKPLYLLWHGRFIDLWLSWSFRYFFRCFRLPSKQKSNSPIRRDPDPSQSVSRVIVGLKAVRNTHRSANKATQISTKCVKHRKNGMQWSFFFTLQNKKLGQGHVYQCIIVHQRSF